MDDEPVSRSKIAGHGRGGNSYHLFSDAAPLHRLSGVQPLPGSHHFNFLLLRCMRLRLRQVKQIFHGDLERRRQAQRNCGIRHVLARFYGVDRLPVHAG